MRNNIQNIVAFFGSDLIGKNPNLLTETYNNGYSLLALDSSAVSLSVKKKRTYTCIDEWVDSKMMLT